MITWHNPNGDLTWQAAFVLFFVLFTLFCWLMVAFDAWQRRQDREYRRQWRRNQIEADSRCSQSYFRNLHRRG